LLVMAKFNRILDIDPDAGVARVQPGVRNLAISQAAAPHGLYYAPDPSSQIACSIGGNVAENAGGVHCLKYGLTVHNVMRVRAVTIDGEIAAGVNANADDINTALDAAFDDDGTAGVVLRINSPGGSPVQAGMVYDEIRRLRAKIDDDFAVKLIHTVRGVGYVLEPKDAA
ncbi:FAD-binding protein, partial [Ralstonia pickettii]|nr:FAD-binding protein [Ralstonia pickettii]